MNITFLNLSMETGGVASVTVHLANVLKEHGHHVSVVLFWLPKSDVIMARLDKAIPVYCLKGYKYSKENVNLMRSVLEKNRTDVVINQFGLPWIPAKIVKKASKGMNVRLVSVYHSDPLANGRTTSVDKVLEKTSSPVIKIILKAKRKVYEIVTGVSMRYVYRISDKYVLLSPTFYENFKKQTHLNNITKLISIPNPVTIDFTDFTFNNEEKLKILLYVGRLENTVKRVDRVINIWSKLERNNPDWKLVIVGDGESKEELKNAVEEKGLKNVSFEGFTNPVDFYKKASLLLLTSDFEGFGLVLVEGMSFGVVPIAYASYDSIHDIVEDRKDGRLIYPDKYGFPENKMVDAIQDLINDDNLRCSYAKNALGVRDVFSTRSVVMKWENLLETIIQEKT